MVPSIYHTWYYTTLLGQHRTGMSMSNIIVAKTGNRVANGSGGLEGHILLV